MISIVLLRSSSGQFCFCFCFVFLEIIDRGRLISYFLFWFDRIEDDDRKSVLIDPDVVILFLVDSVW